MQIIATLFIYCLNHNLLLVLSLHGRVTLFLKDVYSQPTLDIWARNLRNLFSKLLILQNNQPAPSKPCQNPCWTMMVLFTWKRKLAWAAAFINFPFLFSPTSCLSWHGKGPFWSQQVVLRMASPKISSSQRWPFCSFATADVCSPKKKNSFVSLAFHVCNKPCFLFGFFSQWKKHQLKQVQIPKCMQDLSHFIRLSQSLNKSDIKSE